MNDKAIYKCVVFASTHEIEQHGTHFFAWKSKIIKNATDHKGDEDLANYPKDIITHLIEKSNPDDSDGPDAGGEGLPPSEMMLGFSDFMGISVWRGLVYAQTKAFTFLSDGRLHNIIYDGTWQDLDQLDWHYLKDRDMEKLVDLSRFMIP